MTQKIILKSPYAFFSLHLAKLVPENFSNCFFNRGRRGNGARTNDGVLGLIVKLGEVELIAGCHGDSFLTSDAIDLGHGELGVVIAVAPSVEFRKKHVKFE